MLRGKVVVSKRVVLEDGVVAAGVAIAHDGTISEILQGVDLENLEKSTDVS